MKVDMDIGRNTNSLPSSSDNKLRFSSDKLRKSSTRTGSNTVGRGKGIPPGSPLNMIVQDDVQHEFELQVGRAMDVLRQDYPCILTDHPGTYRYILRMGGIFVGHVMTDLTDLTAVSSSIYVDY
jgi:hypothetical protein